MHHDCETRRQTRIDRFKARAESNRQADSQYMQALQENPLVAPMAPVEGDGYTVREDIEDCRILIEFDTKPPEDTRQMMKTYGFRWSRSRSAWARHLDDSGRTALRYVLLQLDRSDLAATAER